MNQASYRDANFKTYKVNPPVPWRAFHTIRKASQYVVVRDGTHIAVTVYLPPAYAGQPLPTIMQATRYHRHRRLTPLAWWLYREQLYLMLRRFVNNGYAWISVDARGSGASFGHNSGAFSHDEVCDYLDVIDWVIQQPWSDGCVGVTGVSYDGTTAERIASQGHPAVKAAAPRFSLFDTWADVVYPGGIHLTWFTRSWGEHTRALDANRNPHWWMGVLNRGVLRICPCRLFYKVAFKDC